MVSNDKTVTIQLANQARLKLEMLLMQLGADLEDETLAKTISELNIPIKEINKLWGDLL